MHTYALRVIVSTSSNASTITQVLVPKSDNNNNNIYLRRVKNVNSQVEGKVISLGGHYILTRFNLI